MVRIIEPFMLPYFVQHFFDTDCSYIVFSLRYIINKKHINLLAQSLSQKQSESQKKGFDKKKVKRSAVEKSRKETVSGIFEI